MIWLLSIVVSVVFRLHSYDFGIVTIAGVMQDLHITPRLSTFITPKSDILHIYLTQEEGDYAHISNAIFVRPRFSVAVQKDDFSEGISRVLH